MEKSIIILTSLILAVILYNYSEFENKGIAYFAVIICLIVIAFSYAKIKYPSETKDEYKKIEEENDKLENFDGIFEYKNDGFVIKQNKIFDFVKWTDIIEVNSFDIPLLKRDKQTGYEIITTSKSYEFNDQETPGIHKLANKLFENLPNWKLDAPCERINNYGLEKANLYKKENGYS